MNYVEHQEKVLLGRRERRGFTQRLRREARWIKRLMVTCHSDCTHKV